MIKSKTLFLHTSQETDSLFEMLYTSQQFQLSNQFVLGQLTP
jgi:hypothetical protein